MKKQSSGSLVRWAAFFGLCSFVFFSCSSTPEPVTKVPSSEVPPVSQVEEEQEGLEAPAEPEVFTTVNFAQRLQRVLSEGSLEDALALFDELPPEY